MVAKKKVVQKKSAGKASLVFSINEDGVLQTNVVASKRVDPRLEAAVQKASDLYLSEALKAGGVLVRDSKGKLLVAEPIKTLPAQPATSGYSAWKGLV